MNPQLLISIQHMFMCKYFFLTDAKVAHHLPTVTGPNMHLQISPTFCNVIAIAVRAVETQEKKRIGHHRLAFKSYSEFGIVELGGGERIVGGIRLIRRSSEYYFWLWFLQQISTKLELFDGLFTLQKVQTSFLYKARSLNAQTWQVL